MRKKSHKILSASTLVLLVCPFLVKGIRTRVSISRSFQITNSGYKPHLYFFFSFLIFNFFFNFACACMIVADLLTCLLHLCLASEERFSSFQWDSSIGFPLPFL